MPSFQQTIIIGHLGSDPDMKYMQNGDAVCNFSVAVSESWKDKSTGEKRESTTWYRVAVWRGQAEACNQYLRKGSSVMVMGNVSARGYLNNNGEAAASLDLTAQRVQFLDSRNGGQSGNNDNGNSAPPASNGNDIPF